MKAIETEYKGFKFRSRSEARWAVFFDVLGVNWQYEKEGYDLGEYKYLPDFWIDLCPDNTFPGWGYWVEIKGKEPTEEEMIKAQLLAQQTDHTTFIFWGYSKDTWRAVCFGHGDGNLRINHGWYIEEFSESRNGFIIDLFFGDEFNNRVKIPILRYIDCFRAVDQSKVIEDAFTQAKSARFEHGYTPNRV